MSDSLLNYLRNERDKEGAAGQAILDEAAEKGVELSPAQIEEVTARKEEYKKLDARVKAREAEIALRADFQHDLGVGGETISSVAKGMVRANGSPQLPATIGQALVESSAFQAIAERKSRGALPQKWTSEAVNLDWLTAKSAMVAGIKAAANPVLESNQSELFGNLSTTAGSLTTLAGFETPGFTFLPLAIADLIPSFPVTVGNTVTLMEVAGRTQMQTSDMPISENAAKFSVGYDFTSVVYVLVKHAAYTKMSDEWLEDAPLLAAYINQDLPFQVRQVEDAYLASVLYSGASNGTALSGSTTKSDGIMEAITDIRNAGGNPDGIIISPTNWAEVQIEKFGTGAGDKEYVGGGPYGPTSNPWGLRVVITPNATDDHPLVGDFARGAKLFRKGGLSVDMTNTDQDDFIKNRVTVRAEQRIVAAKVYSQWFVEADLT